MQKTKLTIIIVNYNTQHLLSRCLDAVADNLKQISGKIIIVDNFSKDDSVNYIRQHFNNVQLITNDKNIGFGRANNQAIAEIEGEYVLLIPMLFYQLIPFQIPFSTWMQTQRLVFWA